MNKKKAVNTWEVHLEQWCHGEAAVFDKQFIERLGDRVWSISNGDRLAAHSLHVELISRIATQPLGYSTGVERIALTSIFRLFQIARDLTKQHPDCATFETIVWHILNTHVRPFTAKWHGKSETGELDALDGTDLFRAELANVRRNVLALDQVLNKIRNVDGYSVEEKGMPPNQFNRLEFEQGVAWRPFGEERSENSSSLCKDEEEKIAERRRHYGISDQNWASGIALSGGGIRSATFSMGVLVALSKRGLLPQFDYLSTVSGGGYSGSFLTQLLGERSKNGDLSLKNDELPFKRTLGESDLLRRIRHGASYLSGSVIERFTLAMAQAQGVFLSFFLLFCGISLFAYVDYLSRWIIQPELLNSIALLTLTALICLFLIMPIFRGVRQWSLKSQQRWVSLIGGLLLLPPLWAGLGAIHRIMSSLLESQNGETNVSSLIIALITVGFLVTAAAALFSNFSIARPLFLSIVSVLLIVLAETTIYQIFVSLGFLGTSINILIALLLVLALWKFLDINSTSLHGFYRRKLAHAFLINEDCSIANPLKLSEIETSRSYFPLINCSLNVPGSVDPKMRGRKADLFTFSPVSAGSDLIGHSKTVDWETANPDLDLATAMALSGAAVSSQMGLQTKLYKSFWLTLLNLRLGAWLKNPRYLSSKKSYPTIKNLLQELFSNADENDAFVQISDGGHIENLGIYELLRRRCRFIVAVDGEQDSEMTFHGLTNLQRLAYIDFGISIDIDLEDLRLGTQGISRSHFRICRIRYPLGSMDKDEEIGYLIYMKLSLTGNEGEFIRRYKFDEPTFPHHTTADQFFNETQFEAYRALGEHVGDKMFLPAITGLADHETLELEDWFARTAISCMESGSQI